LRTFSKDLEMDPDEVAPDPKEMRRQMQVQQQMQQMAQQQEQMAIEQQSQQPQQPQRIAFQRGPDGEITGAMVDGGVVQPQMSADEQLAALEQQLAQIEQGLNG
jgi:hypothetical protein